MTRAGGARAPETERAWAAVAGVADPELPFLTVADLGIVRGVEAGDGRAVVTVTPTYAGCPALDVIRRDLRARLIAAGFADAEVRTALDPPWSSDWISADGRRKLAEAGVAPPGRAPARGSGPVPVTLRRRPPEAACPRCGSRDTEELSAFGATPCTALRRCRACAEPFERVKEV